MKFATTLLTSLLIGFYHLASAQQSSLKLITEVPLQFGVGYEGQLSKRFSVGGSLGVLSSPNSDIIIAYLKYIGTDEKLMQMVDDAFQLGIVGKLNVHYNFNRNYIGLFTQAVGAQAGDVSTALIEDYFNIKITDYPLYSGKNSAGEHLTVRTRLYQLGLLFGHRFPLKNDRLSINVEVGLSKNIGSVSQVNSENRDLTELSKSLDSSLSDFYRKYAYIPSFGVMLVYKLKKEPK